MKRIDLTNMRFGKLTVLRLHGKNHSGRLLWDCRCDCGGVKIAFGNNLNAGRTKSCGCLENANRRTMSTVHGLSKRQEHHIWSNIKQRCTNTKHHAYANYGGRGITVCKRWLGRDGFVNFLTDMGPRPFGYTVERLNNDLGYSPDNCVWATRKDQARNKRSTLTITFQGVTLPLAEWADKCGLDWGTLRRRIKQGWSPEKALTTPRQDRSDAARASHRM